MGAVRTLVRLRLFPAVFTAPEPAAGALGEDYGGPCAAVMASVHGLMGSWQPKVRAARGEGASHSVLCVLHAKE